MWMYTRSIRWRSINGFPLLSCSSIFLNMYYKYRKKHYRFSTFVEVTDSCLLIYFLSPHTYFYTLWWVVVFTYLITICVVVPTKSHSNTSHFLPSVFSDEWEIKGNTFLDLLYLIGNHCLSSNRQRTLHPTSFVPFLSNSSPDTFKIL